MTIKKAIEQYLNYRTSLGEKHRSNRYALLSFSSAIGHECDINNVTLEQCNDYLNHKGRKGGNVTSYWFKIHTALKGFFEWCYTRGLLDIIPLPIFLPPKPNQFIPYIYTNDELQVIFDFALCYRKYYKVSYPEVIQNILKTIYFLGLRPSEAIRLNMSDIHLEDDSYALIRDSKFYKTRMVPFNSKVKAMLSSFLIWRKKVGMTDDGDSPLFFDKKGKRVNLGCLQKAFRCICEKANIKRNTNTSHSDVRLQDLRHTFATNRVLSWYRKGKNVQELLPMLSAYLGHEKLDSTAVYISFVPELIAEAGDLFYNYYQNSY